MRTLIVNGEDAVRAPEAAPAGQQLSGINVNFLDTAIADTTVVHSGDLRTQQIIGERAGRIYFLEAHEVEYLESAGNYVVAHIGANGFLARTTLKGMSVRLAPLGFVQIERSLLVNFRQIAYVERLDRGQFSFVMRGGASLVSSRERSASLRAFFLGATSP